MPAKGRRTRCANGSVSLVTAYVDLPFTVGGITRDVQVDVMPDLWTDCLLGSNFIKTFQAMHNPVTNECMIGLSGSSVLMEFVPIRAAEPPKLSAAGLVEMTQRERAKLEAMLNEILPPKTGPLTHTDWIEHKINVKEGTKPIKQKYYPVSEKRQEELYQQVKDLLDEDIIEPSKSGWSSPIVMVKKSNGKYRMCIDFKKINAISEPDAYPLPYMDSILRKLAKAKYISTLDLSSAYHQINLNEKSRAMTAFTVPGLGLFQYKRMPFGLSYAGATFQRLIDMIVTPELEPNAFAYLDDIIIATETFDDHLRVLKEILSRLNDANLTVNKEKSIFGRSEVKYLGVLVNRDGIKPDPSRVEPILNFPIPKSLKQLRRFLGMSSWYRKFLKDYATLVEPLTRLTSSKVKYVWSMEQQDAFEKIKTLMAEAPLLNCPNFKEKFIVQTDASDTGLGAVLLQIIDGEERVLEFASRVLSSAERNYTVTERECLGVIWAVRKFRQYIEGYEFTVVTDHASLRWLCNLRNPTGRLARWALELQGHLYKVEHRKGSLNHVLDALSRMYEEDKEETATISYVSNSEDAWYTDIWQKIVEDPKDHPNWNIRGGQLYKFRPDANDKNLADDDEGKWKLVVPREQRVVVLRECHDEPTAGHLGREKTYERIAESYFWPRMYTDVADYVRKCQICQQIKVEQRAQRGLMGYRAIRKPWHTVAADIAGPFPKSYNGMEYMLIFEDLFSKWVECIPIRQANGKTILKFFKERIVLRYGPPRTLQTDNGTEFRNELIDDYLHTMNIAHYFNPAYYPQVNIVERTNRTYKTMIKAYVEEDHREWDEKLPELTFAYNTAKQSSTGMSPAELIYGVQPEQPGSFRRELELEAQDQEQDEAVTAWKAKLQGLPEKHEKAAENLKKANEKQAKYYNAGRRTTEFEVGEKVWKISKSLSNAAKGKCAKLAWDFAGPLTVTKKLGPNTFEVQHDKTGKTFSPVHASQLKPHSADEDEDEELRKVKTTNKTRDEECEMVVEKKASGTVVISKEPRTNVAIEKRATKKRTTQRDVVARDKPAEQNTRELDRNSNNSEVNGVEPRQTRSRTKAKIPSHT
uniref:RNA-directed DNA polymerase n=2 Tax=Trichogramma kaykai TaxID=54128 RepID=A0ABD2WL33_9HYME